MRANGWLDRPSTVNKLFWSLCVVCAGLLVVDLVLGHHGHFDFEEIPGFFAFVGFVAFVVIVLAGKGLRKLIRRDEDYYD